MKTNKHRLQFGVPISNLPVYIMINKVFLIIVFLLFVPKTVSGDDVYADQPKIITQDGHLVFMTAANHNITFKSTGKGSIRINDEDLAAVVTSAKRSLSEMDTIKNDDIASMRRSIEQLQNRFNNFHLMESRVNDMEETVRQIQAQLSGSGNGTQLSDLTRSQTQLTRQLQQLRNRFNTVKQLLEKKECNSNPCRNGGTCMDGYNSYTCKCPLNFQGLTCETDVNECQEFVGTVHGCQNGATCMNTFGSYSCQCPPDWYGVHCTERHDDCTSASTQELCSHGTCQNQKRVSSGQPSYTCICDQGWTTDGRTPACDVDIDECQSGSTSCSRNPLVQCINLPGSFMCGPCPAGYNGNGFDCTDIDECLVNNGGCSLSPMVQCINTHGSRQCGPCPAGYQGDGVRCTFFGLCNMNNGGCHPLATCIENTAISSTYRECRCPPGYIGSGFGINGCVSQSGGTAVLTPAPFNPCVANPCIRGTCVPTGPYAFRCNCPIGYGGTHCELDSDECESAPCRNGGTCVDQPNGYVCHCSPYHTGTNCEQEMDACNTYLYEPNGTVHYPSNPSLTYQNDRSCAWIIITTSGKVVNLTFTEFHLEQSENCEFDFLQVNDGNSAANHVIGRFCGGTPPKGGNIISTHNSLYLWFHSDDSVVGDGFQFQWETIDPICGGDIPEATHGVVTSPGYPGQYPVRRDCVWTIRVRLGKRIQISFATLQMEHHENCNFDFLEIRDGLLETVPILGNYCGTETSPPQPIQSSGSFARIYFHSDESRTDMGFHIIYSSVPSVYGCGGLLTTESGAFSSPDHPNPYSHDLECEWQIRVAPNERIRLSFVTFEIEAHNMCRFDYVAIYDGSDETAPQRGRYCGHNLPPIHVSTSNTLFIKFHTDESVVHNGFQATYKVECSRTFTEPQGLIHSPYYPNPYPATRECIYIIRQEPGKAIELRFNAFDIEGSYNCRFDYLMVRDGDSETSPMMNKLCGTVIPAPIISTYNALWLRFKSDGSRENAGFLANYSTIDIACGGILTDISGIITSPNHPDEYLTNVTCRWIIKPPDGYVVRLTFTAFAVESHPNCAFDYVAVYDNTTTENESRLTRRYCGNTHPPVLTSSENLMLVVFHSDASVANDGFTIHYLAFDASTFCSADYFSTVGVIRSPNFPNGYPINKHCTWKIEVPTGQQILLNITRFEIESHRECVYDYVEIRNGGYITSPLIGRYCGTTAPHLIPSHGNQIWVRFVSDRSMSGPGFEIVWDGTTTGCGGELTASQGSIISPNYPESCSSNIDCTWRIVVSRGNKIRIMFPDLDLPTSENCARGGIEIYNGKSSLSPLLKRVCGNSIPNALISETNEVFIRYKCTSWRSTKRGFHLAYETECRVQLSGRRGVIETPNFPNAYPHDRNCSWRIQGPSGNTINMSFAMLHLEESADCRYDFIEVFANQNRTSLGKYCSALQVPRRLSSPTNIASVSFVSDSSFARNGFSMEWIASGCGGEYRKPSGSFSSPNYPQPYPRSTTCDWEITAEPGQNIQLTVQEYDMEGSFNCMYDSLKIYGGPNTRAPVLTSLCHRQTSPVIITSSGNHLYLRFKSDNSRSGRGFNVSYIIQSDACGGIFTLNKGTIYSRNFPNHYLVRDDCSWRVTVTKGHAIHLLFKNFDVEPGTNCSAVYVAVYDGPDEFSPLLMQHCGSTLPANNPFISSNNQLFIQMKAHESISATGFQAEYKMTCGAVLYADEPGDIAIMSQSFASVLPSNCSWIIRARSLADRVTLMFTFLEILRSPLNCSHHLIEIYDGEERDSPLLMGICTPDIPAAITSRGSSLRIVSQNRFNNLRFRAVYSEASAGCGGTFESLSGTFVSPDYPNSYPIDSECVWTIKTAPGHHAMLSFSVFDLEQSDYCNDDYVEIRENNEGGALIGRFCDQILPENLTASHQLWIKFRSNGQGVAQGFVASYNLLYRSFLSGTSGQIANPLYPHAYRGFGMYEWTITVPLGMYVQITFLELDLLHYEFSKMCVASLTFYDGADTTGNELFNYCGAVLQNPVVSNGNQMHILFNSRHALSSSGSTFLLKWNATVYHYLPGVEVDLIFNRTSDCDGIINIEDELVHNLQSPGFPYGYDRNKNCEWLLTSPLGTRIEFHISALDLEPNYGCYGDNINIFGGSNIPGQWIDLDRSCYRTDVGKILKSGTNNMKIVFSSDYSLNGTGFSGEFRATCGGNVTAPSGSIQTPNYPNNYQENDVCDWLISVRPGRTINLQFESFELEGNMPICRNDYVLFRNGRSIESPLLGSGKFCGSSVPSIPDTTSNHVYIQFVSNPSFTWKGFKLTYSEVSLECGGLKMLSQSVTSTRIETPNFPSPYPIQSECEWTIIVPSQSRVRLDFEDHFDIPFDQDCVDDYLTVHDGGTIHAPVLGRFCGHDLPSSLQATGNTMFVRFSSVDTHPSTGFTATAKIATCGGTISADSGVITSPNYPHGYTVGLDCEWIVRAAEGHFLVFTVVDIQTSLADWNSNNCSGSDVLQIRDFNSTGLLIGEFCGETNPSSVSTADNVAYVRFTSRRNSPMMRGFRLTFNISAEECGGEYTTPTGVITSPNYPRPYPSHRQCVWKIYAPYGRLVRLTFTHFNVEGEEQRNCPDWLSAYNVLEYERDYSLLPPFYVCGTNLPSVITSGSNFMLLKFFTNEQNSGSGFRAVYDTDLEFECGGDLLLPTGNVISPGFELGNYTHNLDCRWYLNAQRPNSTFVFKVDHLVLESSPSGHRHGLCRYDRLEILSGLDTYTAFSFASFCGNYSNPFVIAVPFSQLILRFKTDSSVVYTGFNLTYSMSDCGGELNGAGIITSPGFPTAYSNDVVCAWVVKFEDGQQVQITFEDFALESSNDCTSDYVLVRNGMSSNSPVIGKYCGNEKPRDIKSHRHEVLIEFHTNSASVDRGFRISATPVTSGCGGILSGKEGEIKSVGYPSKYPANVECEWNMETNPGFYLNLTFIGRFDLEMSPNCDRDFVEGFHFIDGNWVSLGRRCGRDVPLPYLSRTPKFRLLFRSNEAVDGDGFVANWTESCGGTFTDSVGVITSPNYPNTYPVSVDCVYVIASDPSHYVVLEFDDDFTLEGPTDSSPDCVYDMVRIYTGNNTGGTLLTEACGTAKPAIVTSLGSITIQFTSDSSVSYKGFHARYRVSECGGIFNHSAETNAFGMISSPTHPERYHGNMNCTWIIEVQPNGVVDFKFQQFELENEQSCMFDYVSFYDGSDTSSQLLGRFCGSEMPENIRTTGNYLTLQFITDDVVERKGFKGVYRRTYGAQQGCGGVLNTTFGTVQSLDIDHDGKYETGLDCQWTIIGASFKVLRLTFHTFDVEKLANRDDCPWDYLEIRDGPSSDSALIERLCGSNMPNPILSSTNQLWLKFASGEVEVRGGFQATFESVEPVCGGVFNATDIAQTIQSPNFPENYPINLRCHWTVVHPNRKQGIELHFIEVDLEDSYRCTKDSISIRDYGNSIRRYMNDKLYCGHVIPFNEYYGASSRRVEIYFNSDSSVAGKGFQLSYQLASCNRTYTLPSGSIIKYLSYGGGNQETSCIYQITVPENRTITVSSEQFSIDSTNAENCDNSYLQIRDGSSETAPLLGTYCGYINPDPISSSGNQLWIKLYEPHGSVSMFQLLYYSTTQGRGCGGDIVATEGRFSSTNYPRNISGEFVCRWTVTVPNNKKINLQFLYLDIQDSENCTNNYLQIFDSKVESDNHLLNTFCGSEIPSFSGTTGNSLLVKYVTDSGHRGIGFKIYFYSQDYSDAEESSANIVPRE